MRISCKSHQAARDIREADYSLKAQKKPEKIEIHHKNFFKKTILQNLSPRAGYFAVISLSLARRGREQSLALSSLGKTAML
ncbi:hypothetical protein VSF3289_03380 [Vibrio scophthalmi]|uniref:Uncharacterized protein n=1 Tax=Vibrio scophthalmi TaxID=45658 RepID=A0A1E3WEJ6_9VIBR|nr:hypothetical protein VSF3289_03380 [Vibrio scophthalmi]